MRYGNRSTWQKLVSSPLSMIAAAILLAVLARAAWNISDKAAASETRLAAAAAELSTLRERQGELQAGVARLSTPEGIEAEIRNKYHATKEGESVAVIVDGSRVAAAATASATTSASAERGFWQRLLRLAGF